MFSHSQLIIITDGDTANDPVTDPADSPHENTPAANDPVPEPADLFDLADLVDPPEDMLDEIYHNATEVSFQVLFSILCNNN